MTFRHVAIVVVVVVVAAALAGCVRPYVRDNRDPRLAAQAPCRPGEACAQGASPDDAGFQWTTEVMESAR